jgi:hypothetical protein
VKGKTHNQLHTGCVDVDECNATLTGCSVTEFDDCMTPGCTNTEGSFRCQLGFAADENATDALYERILNPTAEAVHRRQTCYIPEVEPIAEGATKTAQPAATLELDDVEPAQLVKGSPAQKALVLRLRTEMANALNILLTDVVIDELEPVGAGTAERRRLGTTVTFSVMLRQGDQMQKLKTQLAEPSSPLLLAMAAAEIGLDAQQVEMTVACPAGTRLENGACAKCHGDKYAAEAKVFVNGDMVSTVQCESCPHKNEVPNTRGDGCVCAAGSWRLDLDPGDCRLCGDLQLPPEIPTERETVQRSLTDGSTCPGGPGGQAVVAPQPGIWVHIYEHNEYKEEEDGYKVELVGCQSADACVNILSKVSCQNFARIVC